MQAWLDEGDRFRAALAEQRGASWSAMTRLAGIVAPIDDVTAQTR